MEITDRTAVARALAEQYRGGRYAKPWEVVEQYREVLDYTARKPNLGSSAVAARLDLPRSRIRPWMDGSRPDPVRAIETAEDYGWLDLEYGACPFRGLNILVAWIFAGGSINKSFVPSFTIDDDEMLAVLARVCDCANTPSARIERTEDDCRATEAVIEVDASVFGRLLVALGAPVGNKGPADDIALPAYLMGAPEETRLTFARTVVWHRGTQTAVPNYPIQVREERTDRYWMQLRWLFESLVGSDAIGGAEPCIRFDEDASERLYRPPEV